MRYPLFRYQHIVFDWNGTVIDDVDLALACVNRLRSALELETITKEAYRGSFRFPIRDFYRDLGFDFDRSPFDLLIARYLAHFDAEVAECSVSPGFLPLVELLRRNGANISVLSASHHEILAATARRHGIEQLVHRLVGLTDSAAAGKVGRARELDRQLRRRPDEPVLMIGDTDHDHEVAVACGWDFVAVASGHQSRERLEGLGAPVVDGLYEIAAMACVPLGSCR